MSQCDFAPLLGKPKAACHGFSLPGQGETKGYTSSQVSGSVLNFFFFKSMLDIPAEVPISLTGKSYHQSTVQTLAL